MARKRKATPVETYSMVYDGYYGCFVLVESASFEVSTTLEAVAELPWPEPSQCPGGVAHRAHAVTRAESGGREFAVEPQKVSRCWERMRYQSSVNLLHRMEAVLEGGRT